MPTEQRAGAFAVTQSVFVYDRILGDHLQGVLDGTLTPDQALTGAFTEISKLQGGVAAFLDAAGVAGGVAACGSTAGVACALGLLGAAGAANHLYGDARQAVTGEAAKSILEVALEKQGYSAADAAKYQAYVDAGILVATVGTVGGQTVYGFAVNASKLGGANSASRVLQGVVADAEIGASKIDDVDAGYIRLAGTRSEPRVVGSEATPAERDLMKSVMPDVYPFITFTKFGL